MTCQLYMPCAGRKAANQQSLQKDMRPKRAGRELTSYASEICLNFFSATSLLFGFLSCNTAIHKLSKLLFLLFTLQRASVSYLCHQFDHIITMKRTGCHFIASLR